jgi:hypothetical protein
MTAEHYGWPKILEEVFLPRVCHLDETNAVAV